MKQNRIFFKLIATVFAFSMTAVFATPEMSAAGRTETEKALKDFYVEYVTSMASDFSTFSKNREDMKNEYFSESFGRKYEETVENHGYDPLINAQDFARENIPTIRVESEGGHWYKVTYRDSYSNKPVEVHLKAKGRTGHLRLLDFK